MHQIGEVANVGLWLRTIRHLRGGVVGAAERGPQLEPCPPDGARRRDSELLVATQDGAGGQVEAIVCRRGQYRHAALAEPAEGSLGIGPKRGLVERPTPG